MQARKVPTIMEELTEYFLDTEAPEMEFEIARCRPLITAEYFAFLDTRIGEEGLTGWLARGRVARQAAEQHSHQQQQHRVWVEAEAGWISWEAFQQGGMVRLEWPRRGAAASCNGQPVSGRSGWVAASCNALA
jgi:hypothetical protein